MEFARLISVLIAVGTVACVTESPLPQRANPASENCIQQGGKHVAEQRPDGGQFGVCQFEDNRQCEEWALLRGQCQSGGVRITGYVTSAARYCAITGGRYVVTQSGANEQGTCTLPGGTTCDADAYYRGTCNATTGGGVSSTAPAKPTGSWLDSQPANWNIASQSVPKAPVAEEPLEAVIKRCRLTQLQSTSGERALAAAGWIPFHAGGQQLTRDDVEIVGGMTGADGMCRPTAYNLFVFAGGAFAGTLAPAVMTSRLDGSSGNVEWTSNGIAVQFSRYTESDPLCCPSSRVLVRYRIDRSPASVVVPVTVTPVPAKQGAE